MINTETEPRARGRTQAERREEAEAQLLAAALRVVAERGTERMTLALVGEEAGYSRGLATHYFGSKSDLLAALAQEIGRQFKERLRERPKSRGGLDALHSMVDLYFDTVQNMTPAARALLVLMVESSNSDQVFADSIAAFNRETVSFVSAQLQLAFARKEIPEPVDCASIAVFIVGMLRGVMLHRLVDPDQVDVVAVRRCAHQSINRLLGASYVAATESRSSDVPS
ncbi:MAG: TetR/AcrR family transcriptional regulator [Cupriavidus necator]